MIGIKQLNRAQNLTAKGGTLTANIIDIDDRLDHKKFPTFN
jgi:hypothetical protein